MQEKLTNELCSGYLTRLRLRIAIKMVLIPVLLFFSIQGFSQILQVKGKVIDSLSAALTGVDVAEKGTANIVTTKEDGSFTINVRSTSAKLVFSYVGYEPTELTVGTQSNILVSLKRKQEDLDDVVVVGYGRQKKVSVVGAISTVSTKELKQSPAANLSNALVGRLPGLIALQNSGEPGYDGSQLRIRGNNSFGADNNPLVLVDGIQRDFSNLDPNEVESVSILKDASATAVYGVAGANGVILVTTRRGKIGPVQVSFSAESSVQAPTRLSKYLGSYEYALLINEALTNDGSAPQYSADDLQKYKDGSDPFGHPNTDFFKEVLRDYAEKSSYNLNFSGGTKMSRFFVNVGYQSQGGIYKYFEQKDYDANARFKRYNFRTNLDIDISEDMSVTLDLAGRIEHRHFPGTSAADLFNSINRIPPNAFPLFTPDGKFGGSIKFADNPAGRISHKGFYESYTSALQGTFRVSRKLNWITDGLGAAVSFAFDNTGIFSRARNQDFEVWVYEPSTQSFVKHPGTNATSLQPPAEWSDGARNQSVLEASLNYKRSFDRHDVTGLILYTQRSRTIQGAQYGKPFVNQGIVGRATWAFENRYFAEINGRYDGSENFAKGKQFGFFPSMAVGWLVSQERFFDNLRSIISSLKIRGSFGFVGNDQLNGRRFLFQSIFADAEGYPFGNNPRGYASGLAESSIGNPDVTWENAQIANIGLEFKLFKNRLSFYLELFRQKREDILFTKGTIPGIVGANLPAVNIGKTKNQGFEVELEYRVDNIKAPSYYVKGNVSFARNKILFQDEPVPRYGYQSRTGQRIGQPYGLVFAGFYRDAADIARSPKSEFGSVKPGDTKYIDQNGDGVVNSFDQVPIGHPAFPEWVYGISAGLKYKGFDASVLFQGARNSSVYFRYEASWEFFNGGKVLEEHLNRWTPATADVATYPLLHTSENGNNHAQPSDFWQRSGDYLRLKILELGYTLPQALISKIKIQSIRIYLQGQNLITWDKIKVLDPEAPSGRGAFYPQQKVFNAGINIVF